QDAGPATVSGRLLDPQGRTVAELAPRTLAGGALAGTGWTLDSAALAAWPAVIPRLRFAAGDGGAIERDAPMIRPVAGWIQNQVVVKATLQELAPGPARLVLRQQGAGVEAEVAVAGDDPVVAASLWRNDRPLAAFDPAGGPAALLVEIVPCARTHTDLEVELGPRGGRIVRAAEAGPWKEGDGEGRTVTVDAQGGVRMHLAMALPQHLPRRRLMALWQAAGDDRLRVRLHGAGQEAVLELSAAELAAGDGVLALDGEGRPLAELRCPDYDPWLDALIAPLAAPTTLRFRRLTRPARPGDLWHARVRFASGRTAESPPVAASDALCEGVVLSGAGDLDDDGAREVGAAPPREATAAASGLPPVGTMRTLAMPRAVARAASWDFEGGLMDAIGDRDLAVPGAQRPLEVWRRLLVVADGRGCLRLDGAELALRTRSWPAGPCRIALTVRIDEVAGEGGLLAGRSGGSSAVAIRIRADRSLEAVRDGGGEAVRVHLADLVPRNAWVRITARYDGGTLALSCDGRTATVAAPAVQFQHNCTPLLGKGVHGLVEAFEVSSCPGPPL
ncbi:MAG: LamG domain-containing protein, partial [Planctomycetes bacterium]|nr:LamG domain-containing protein [Planctomycetota bacterium]